jgi:hypothetical protein
LSIFSSAGQPNASENILKRGLVGAPKSKEARYALHPSWDAPSKGCH